MASISYKREDWNAIDPVRDIKFLAECIQKEEAHLARTPEKKVKNDLTPELVAKLLPPEMTVGVCVVLRWNPSNIDTNGAEDGPC